MSFCKMMLKQMLYTKLKNKNQMIQTENIS